jgi:hypothetical protein
MNIAALSELRRIYFAVTKSDFPSHQRLQSIEQRRILLLCIPLDFFRIRAEWHTLKGMHVKSTCVLTALIIFSATQARGGWQ